MSAEELRLRGDSSSNITAAMPLERATWPQCPAKDKGEEERDGEEEVDGEERWQSKFISKQKEGKGVEEEEVEMDDDEPWQFTGPSAGGSPNQSDESEPESPPAFIRRKVSFADAFGLDLVYVKEFSNQTSDDKVEDLLCGLDVDEYYLSCVFTLPTSPQVLAETVEERKVALESLELMPGTTTLRGTVRVANLCFDKAVYVRTTYDSWGSHFDLLTEYVPGSSDRESDGFGFKLTLVPPLDAAGIRVEFCLRYESAVGEFWDSNNGQNYTLYCKRREHLIPESKGKRREEEEEEEKAKEMEIEKERLKEKKKKVPKVKSTRSCLKRPSKKTSPEPDPVVVSGTAEIPDTVSQRAARPASKTVDSANKRADEERLQKSLVDSRMSRRRARLSQVRAHFAQRQMEALLGHCASGEGGTSESPPLIPASSVEAWNSAPLTSTGLLKDERTDTRIMDQAPVLTYHQIPLLSLSSWDKNSTAGQKDLSSSSAGNQDLCRGATVVHSQQRESGHSVPDRVSASYTTKEESDGVENSSITAVEELESRSPPPIVSPFRLIGDQSDPMEPVQVAQLQTQMVAAGRDSPRPPANEHVTLAVSPSDMDPGQECDLVVIDDPQGEVAKAVRPDLDLGLGLGLGLRSRRSRRAEVEGVTRDQSRVDNEELGATHVSAGVEVEHSVEQQQHLAAEIERPALSLRRGTNALKQVTRPWATGDVAMAGEEAKTEAESQGKMAQEGETAEEGTLQLVTHTRAEAEIEVLAQTVEQAQTPTQRAENKPEIGATEVQTIDKTVMEASENEESQILEAHTCIREDVGIQACENRVQIHAVHTATEDAITQVHEIEPQTDTSHIKVQSITQTAPQTMTSSKMLEIDTEEARQRLMKPDEETASSPPMQPQERDRYTVEPAEAAKRELQSEHRAAKISAAVSETPSTAISGMEIESTSATPGEPLGISAVEQVLPGCHGGEGGGAAVGGVQSVNTATKVTRGESQDVGSAGYHPAAPGNRAATTMVTFKDGDGTTAHEHAHPMRQRVREKEDEREQERRGEEEGAMMAAGTGEFPFKTLNERQHKESAETSGDTIGIRPKEEKKEEEEDLSGEMSHLKEVKRQDVVSAISQTDRLEGKASKYGIESYIVAKEEEEEADRDEDWRDEMEKCLGLRREQGYVSEPALYEQFTKATKGLMRDPPSNSLTAKHDETDSSTGQYRGSESQYLETQNQGTVACEGSKELLDAPTSHGPDGGTTEDIPVVHSNTNAPTHRSLEKDMCLPLPVPVHTSSDSPCLHSTLLDQDLYLAGDVSPLCQEGAVSWYTARAVLPSPGDDHGTANRVRGRRRSSSLLRGLQTIREEGEGHMSSDVASPQPLTPLGLSKLRSLGPFSKVAAISLLFAFFCLTAYVCDLPLCLAIYLVSLCWWCSRWGRDPPPLPKGLE